MIRHEFVRPPAPAIDTERGPHWSDDAACRDYDPELWFSLDPVERNTAKAICDHECPVRDACAAAAASKGEKFGVWAGKDRERNLRTTAIAIEPGEQASGVCPACLRTGWANDRALWCHMGIVHALCARCHDLTIEGARRPKGGSAECGRIYAREAYHAKASAERAEREAS